MESWCVQGEAFVIEPLQIFFKHSTQISIKKTHASIYLIDLCNLQCLLLHLSVYHIRSFIKHIQFLMVFMRKHKIKGLTVTGWQH